MPRFYLIFSILALSLFSYGQYRGIGLFDGLFDESAGNQPASMSQSSRSTSHK